MVLVLCYRSTEQTRILTLMMPVNKAQTRIPTLWCEQILKDLKKRLTN